MAAVCGAGGVAAALGSLASACQWSDCSFDGTCTGQATSDGGDGGDGDTLVETGGPDVPSGTCGAKDEPKDNPACVDNAFGVFVSPQGADANAGTKDKPLKTIGAGLTKAKAQGKRAFVCGGTYAEQLVVDVSLDGAKAYGGFTCDKWAYDATQKPVVGLSAATGKAACTSCSLVVDSLATGATFEDFVFQSPSGVSAGNTNIAVFVKGSANVTLRRVAIVGGAGGDGTPGAAGTLSPNYSTASAPVGNSANGLVGGMVQPNSCADGTSTQGGGAGSALSNGSPGTPAILPVSPAGNTGAGGDTTKSCNSGGGGGDGSFGGGGGSGSGANSTGVYALATDQWTLAAGTDGTNGQPGQGGGGGAGKTAAGGGGGGAGGCGGATGKRGTSGGASFALVTVNAAISLDHCTITGAKAGVGGKGGDGQLGQSQGAAGNPTVGACQGGAGGFGGGGGGAGGGAGGLSVALAYIGTKPVYAADTAITAFATVATGGAGGAGGTSGGGATWNGANGTKGVDGVSVDVMLLPIQ